jgi:hypothetical protein
MTPRQAYALAHPITDPVAVVSDRELYRTRRDKRSGLLITSCLAVDR